MIMKKIHIFFFPALLVMIFSCTSGGQKEATSQEIKAKETAMDSMTRKAASVRAAYISQLKEMNSEQLVRQMDKESDRGLEPFNSLSFSEAVNRGPALAGDLVQMMKDTTRTSLLTLLALNRIEPKFYEKVRPSVRVAILLDALKNSELYNTFGLPHVRTEQAGTLIIMEGKNIRKGLITLLSDKKEAPVWGSEDYSEYLQYKYRVCDYALFYLVKIDGDEKFTMPKSPEERDSIIKERF